MKPKTVYKVNVTFQGTASLEIEADNTDEARRLASELTVIDLARQGHTDILSFKIGAREVTPVKALSGWRREIFGKDALALKHGRLALTVRRNRITLVELADRVADPR